MKYNDEHSQQLLELLFSLDNNPGGDKVEYNGKECPITIYNRGRRGERHLAAVLVRTKEDMFEAYIGMTEKGTWDCHEDLIEERNHILSLDEEVLKQIKSRIFDL